MDVAGAYQTLNLDQDASMDQVKVSYRRLALELHPDKNKGDDARFKRVTEAYHIIKDQKPGAKKISGRDHGSGQKRNGSMWGAPPGPRGKGAPPEEDWSRYTKEFEEDASFWKEYERNFWQMYNDNINADGKNGEYEKTEEPPDQPNLDVRVDPTLCIGCCSCEIIAPEVFWINKNTKMNPKSRVHNMRGAGINKIMNAAQTCPTKAIFVDDIDSGQRLHPR